MSKTTLERVLVYRGRDGEMTRYEIFKNEENPPNNIDYILVYREVLIDGNRCWVRTDDAISLEHLGFRRGGGFPNSVQSSMAAPRDISSAVDECNKHWANKYA
ncbi:hypothetical protein VEL98_003931 [Cronobacter sakazakii]|nr:hypothetical protein [Cronobacter sakazakii]